MAQLGHPNANWLQVGRSKRKESWNKVTHVGILLLPTQDIIHSTNYDDNRTYNKNTVITLWMGMGMEMGVTMRIRTRMNDVTVDPFSSIKSIQPT